jgi:F0F1-type ATP synthase assembly protein I
MADNTTEAEFEQRMAALKEELREAQKMDDPFLIANLEAQITTLDSGLAEFREQAAEIDREFHDRLNKLEARADAVKATKAAKQAVEIKQLKTSADEAKGLGIGLTMAYTLLGCPVAGYLIGLAVEKSGGPPYVKDWGAVIGIVVGFGAMLILIKRTNSDG